MSRQPNRSQGNNARNRWAACGLACLLWTGSHLAALADDIQFTGQNGYLYSLPENLTVNLHGNDGTTRIYVDIINNNFPYGSPTQYWLGIPSTDSQRSFTQTDGQYNAPFAVGITTSVTPFDESRAYSYGIRCRTLNSDGSVTFDTQVITVTGNYTVTQGSVNPDGRKKAHGTYVFNMKGSATATLPDGTNPTDDGSGPPPDPPAYASFVFDHDENLRRIAELEQELGEVTVEFEGQSYTLDTSGWTDDEMPNITLPGVTTQFQDGMLVKIGDFNGVIRKTADGTSVLTSEENRILANGGNTVVLSEQVNGNTVVRTINISGETTTATTSESKEGTDADASDMTRGEAEGLLRGAFDAAIGKAREGHPALDGDGNPVGGDVFDDEYDTKKTDLKNKLSSTLNDVNPLANLGVVGGKATSWNQTLQLGNGLGSLTIPIDLGNPAVPMIHNILLFSMYFSAAVMVFNIISV